MVMSDFMNGILGGGYRHCFQTIHHIVGGERWAPDPTDNIWMLTLLTKKSHEKKRPAVLYLGFELPCT